MNYLIINFKNVFFCTLNSCKFIGAELQIMAIYSDFYLGVTTPDSYREVGLFVTIFLLVTSQKGFPLQSLTRVSHQYSVISSQSSVHFFKLTSSQEST
jgi:hypothetical protein